MTETREDRALALANRLLDPEDLGFTANAEIRDAARRVLGRAPVETAWKRKPIISQPQPVRQDPPPPPAKQSKVHSLIESLANVAVGFGVALVSQLVIFPLYGIHIPLSTNIYIVVWFTAISVARSYVLRRWFNDFKPKGK